MSAELQPHHYPKVYRQLLGYVEKHEMQILHDDGLYRHIRFKSPGTSIGYFDIITWPGSLAITGDIGEGHIFTRERDMIAWFYNPIGGYINPGYWAEKLSRGARDAVEFSSDKFAAWVRDIAGSRHDVDEMVEEAEHFLTSEEAVDVLDHRDIYWDFEDVESWRDYRHHFLLACHAILWGVQEYVKNTTDTTTEGSEQ
ncbi:hypothetical protein [Microbacterium sp. YY-01]|uniref:hypothetical protein n=1 Tax=Microbacterium sp. YY-01 TaxID=3421634 RepID=UPI003D163415